MDKKEFNFHEQLKLGKAGEDKIFKYLNNLPETVDVWNMSDNKKFQSYGMDGVWVIDKDDAPFNFIGFDVKTDYKYHTTGRLFIEIYSNVNSGKKGGILSTKANIFLYYCPYSGKLFKVPIYAMKKWYERIGVSIDHKVVKNEHGMESTGIPIRPEDLVADGVPITTMQGVGPLIKDTLQVEYDFV